MHFFRYASKFEKQSAISYLKIFHIHNSFGFGSRKFGETGWYWGWSIYGGRYLNTDWPIMNIEFFKFGKTF